VKKKKDEGASLEGLEHEARKKAARALRDKLKNKLVEDNKVYGPEGKEGRKPASFKQSLKKSSEYKSFDEEKSDKDRLVEDERMEYFQKAKKNNPNYIKNRIAQRMKEDAPEEDLERKARMEYLRRKRQGKK
jgi:hypothetical protein